MLIKIYKSSPCPLYLLIRKATFLSKSAVSSIIRCLNNKILLISITFVYIVLAFFLIYGFANPLLFVRQGLFVFIFCLSFVWSLQFGVEKLIPVLDKTNKKLKRILPIFYFVFLLFYCWFVESWLPLYILGFVLAVTYVFCTMA